MTGYILRRLGLAVLTILGVMLISFLLFREVAGDIAGANLGEKATTESRAAWLHSHGYDLPKWVNLYHKQLSLEDATAGPGQLGVTDGEGSNAVYALGLFLSETPGQHAQISPLTGRAALNVLRGRYVWRLSPETPLNKLTESQPLTAKTRRAAPAPEPETAPATAPGTQPGSLPAGQSAPPEERGRDARDTAARDTSSPAPSLIFTLADESSLRVELRDVKTAGELIAAVNSAPGNDGQLIAGLTDWRPSQLLDSQFFRHLWESATFQARSLKDNRKLTEIIADRAPASLSVQAPAFGIEWLIGLAIACFVAYYRDSLIDRAGVFLAVLGMCIPFLAFMIYGQALMFELSPKNAFGVIHKQNVFVPIVIIVLAGLGGQVRFYRTIILDETNRDYVRTALSKGLPLTAVLFKHVLKNCMLPILTSLILTIPFLMMGGLLVESYFGIPGLGDLMLTSIQDRNEPIMSAMVFLTALIYTFGVLLTDICYAIFDPRIRLR